MWELCVSNAINLQRIRTVSLCSWCYVYFGGFLIRAEEQDPMASGCVTAWPESVPNYSNEVINMLIFSLISVSMDALHVALPPSRRTLDWYVGLWRSSSTGTMWYQDRHIKQSRGCRNRITFPIVVQRPISGRAKTYRDRSSFPIWKTSNRSLAPAVLYSLHST